MFSLKRADKGNNPAVKEFPAAAGTYTVGQACALTNGYITQVSGTATPTYVTAGAGTLASGDTIAVNPIYDDMEFVTELVGSAALKKGDKVTISSTFDSVTTTTTSGVATIVEIAGTTSGSAVVVKFE